MNRELRVFRHEDIARCIAAAISTREPTNLTMVVRFTDGYRVVTEDDPVSLVGLGRGRLVSTFERGHEVA